MAFEWSCVAGHWSIAGAMLARCATLAPELRPCVDQYRGCLQAELQRASVFLGQAASGPTRPNILPGTRRWVSQRQSSLLAASEPGRPTPNRCNNPGRLTPPALSGRTNLGPFAWFYDSDDRLGPICEVFLGGNYFWVPFEMMSAMAFPRPVYLLDRVWRPVEIRLRNGIRRAGFVPARYVGSQWVDDELKLGHGTAWIWLNAWQQAGLGERQFCSELCCWPLSQLTAIRFHSFASPRSPPAKAPRAGDSREMPDSSGLEDDGARRAHRIVPLGGMNDQSTGTFCAQRWIGRRDLSCHPGAEGRCGTCGI